MPAPGHCPVYIVDDDQSVREATRILLEAAGFRPVLYETGTAFLQSADLHSGGCALLDICMPGATGLEVQTELAGRASTLSVIVVTGHGDVATAVQAMKAGATDFLEKPYEPETLLEAVDRALQLSTDRATGMRTRDAKARISRLTPRECQLLHALMAGGSNKSIARVMNVSPRTVEMYRANMMDRLGARSLSEAVRIAYDAGLTTG